MISGIVLAGVTGSGKSTAYRLLKHSLSLDRASSLCTFDNDIIQNPGLELWRENRSIEQILQYLRTSMKLIHRLLNFPVSFGTAGKARFFVLCESWALNLLAELDLWLPSEFKELDALRARIGISIVHLTIGPDEVLERSVRSTQEHRGDKWYRYVKSLGKNETAQVNVFERRRCMLARYFEISQEAKLEINTSGMAWHLYVDEMLNFAGMNVKTCLGA